MPVKPYLQQQSCMWNKLNTNNKILSSLKTCNIEIYCMQCPSIDGYIFKILWEALYPDYKG